MKSASLPLPAISPGLMLLQMSHRRSLLRSSSIKIYVNNVLLSPLQCDYPSVNSEFTLTALPDVAYSSILVSTIGLSRSQMSALSPPYLLYRSASSSKNLLCGEQSSFYNVTYTGLDHVQSSKDSKSYNSPGIILGSVEYDRTERGWVGGRCGSLDGFEEICDGFICSLVRDGPVAETLDLLSTVLQKSLPFREHSIRSSLGLRVCTALRTSLTYRTNSWEVPYKDVEHNSSLCRNIVNYSSVKTSLLNILTTVLSPTDLTSPLTTHKRTSDYALIALQIFLSIDLYSSDVLLATKIWQIVADTYCYEGVNEDGYGLKVHACKFFARVVGLQKLCDLIRLRCNWVAEQQTLGSGQQVFNFQEVAIRVCCCVCVQELKGGNVRKGELAVKSLTDCLAESGLGSMAGGVVIGTMRKLVEWADPDVNRRFGQGLLQNSFHSVIGLCTLAMINPTPPKASLSWVPQWRNLLCVYTWLSSAAGVLGSRCSKTLGIALMEVARAGKLEEVSSSTHTE